MSRLAALGHTHTPERLVPEHQLDSLRKIAQRLWQCPPSADDASSAGGALANGQEVVVANRHRSSLEQPLRIRCPVVHDVYLAVGTEAPGSRPADLFADRRIVDEHIRGARVHAYPQHIGIFGFPPLTRQPMPIPTAHREFCVSNDARLQWDPDLPAGIMRKFDHPAHLAPSRWVHTGNPQTAFPYSLHRALLANHRCSY